MKHLNIKEEMIKEEISKNIKNFIIENKIKQKHLAGKIGMQVAQFNRYATGVSLANAENLKKIAKAMKISVDKLIGGNQKPEKIGEGMLIQYFKNEMENLSVSDNQFIDDCIKIIKMQKMDEKKFQIFKKTLRAMLESMDSDIEN